MTTTTTTAVFSVRCAESHCRAPITSIDASTGTPSTSRAGYINLLLPQHHSSKDPGYSKEMIAGRRDFFDAALTHFSPVSAEDFRRVVKPTGVVLVGGPGEGHLFSFKELLYDIPARHETTDTLGGEAGFELIDTHSIRYPLSLRGPGQVANLLLMTPFSGRSIKRRATDLLAWMRSTPK